MKRSRLRLYNFNIHFSAFTFFGITMKAQFLPDVYVDIVLKGAL